MTWVTVGAAVFSGPGASAHDHRPPRALMRSEHERQEGRPLESFWTTPDGDELCLDQEASNSLRFPRRLVSTPGATATVVLSKKTRPVSVEVDAWHQVKSDGSPKGDPTPVEHIVAPKVKDGQTVAWKVVFMTEPTPRHYYTRLQARWQDEEGCGGNPDLGFQHASWTFHLRTRN
jgi:hypothetical protein